MSDFNRVRLTWKEAAGGLYGYPKQTQKDCEVAIRKVDKKTAALAQQMFQRDRNVSSFLKVHASRTDSMSARLLVAAIEPWERVLDPKLANEKEARGERGLYGFSRKTATLGLSGCTDLRDFTGSVAYSLHSRRAARYEQVTGFFDRHAGEGGCSYSRILLSSYPDIEVLKAAGLDKSASVPEDWLSED